MSPSFSSIFLAELVAGQLGGHLAQAVLIQAAGLAAHFQRAAAAHWPLDADIALVDLAGRVGHLALVAGDGDADAVVEAEDAQVDVALAVDRQAGNARLEVGVVGHAVAQAQAALQGFKGRVLAARVAAQGLCG